MLRLGNVWVGVNLGGRQRCQGLHALYTHQLQRERSFHSNLLWGMIHSAFILASMYWQTHPGLRLCVVSRWNCHWSIRKHSMVFLCWSLLHWWSNVNLVCDKFLRLRVLSFHNASVWPDMDMTTILAVTSLKFQHSKNMCARIDRCPTFQQEWRKLITVGYVDT